MVGGMIAAFLAASTAGASSPANLIKDPDWASLPSDYEIEYVYPERAGREAVIGRVVMICIATAEGRMQDCSIESADPEGYEFEAATLRSAHLFILKPTTKSGEPVAGRPVRVALRFVMKRKPLRPVALLVPGKVNARVTLDCRMTPAGRFEQCQVLDETPEGQGFGEAALIVPGKLVVDSRQNPRQPIRATLVVELRGKDAPKK